jgi:hypothetical protein
MNPRDELLGDIKVIIARQTGYVGNYADKDLRELLKGYHIVKQHTMTVPTYHFQYLGTETVLVGTRQLGKGDILNMPPDFYEKYKETVNNLLLAEKGKLEIKYVNVPVEIS